MYVDLDELIRSVLDELDEDNMTPKQRVRRIIRRAEMCHELEPGTLVSDRRTKNYTDARREAIAEAWTTVPVQSIPWLARIFKRDHTTIIHAMRRAGVWEPKRPGVYGNDLHRGESDGPVRKNSTEHRGIQEPPARGAGSPPGGAAPVLGPRGDGHGDGPGRSAVHEGSE